MGGEKCNKPVEHLVDKAKEESNEKERGTFFSVDLDDVLMLVAL